MGERDEFGCCCTPCPCCHVSMETREGQDVAHSDNLGGWQGRHLVNISPSIPTQHPAHTTVPSQPPSSLPAPLPSLLELVSGQLDFRQGCCCPLSSQALLATAGVSASIKLRSSLSRAGGGRALVKSSGCAPMTLCNCCSQTSLPRQNLKKKHRKFKWVSLETIQNNSLTMLRARKGRRAHPPET